MTPEQWRKIEALVEAALEHPTERRPSFLDQTIGADTELRRVVDGLLDAHRQVGDQLESPAIEHLHRNTTFADAPQVPRPYPSITATTEQIGPYRIVRELGSGGMGSVYLAERDDDAFERQVAIKLVRAELGFGVFEAQFHRERQILANLDHPNIARLHDGGRTDDGRSYFVMEHIDGQSLDRYCDEHELGLRERLALFTDVCRAVQYAHQNLVVHRDLKPNNVLVTQDGTVKLLDFGIAKLLEPSEQHDAAETTHFGSRALTPNYASPEQLRGQAVSTASDVYSLGVMLYQLLTGARPYSLEAPDPTALEHILERDLTPPSKVTPEATAKVSTSRRAIRGDLDTIVLKCLQREPSRRYGSAEALVEDLERHRVGLPIRARKDTAGYRLRRFVQRNKLATTLAATIFLLTASLAGVMASRERKIRNESVRSTHKLSQALFVTTSAQRVDSYISSLNCLAVQISHLRGIHDPSARPAVSAFLHDILETWQALAAIVVVNAQEREVLRAIRPEFHKELEHLKGDLESGRIFLDQPTQQLGLDRKWLALPTRLKSGAGTLLLVADSKPLFEATRPGVPDNLTQNFLLDIDSNSLFSDENREVPRSGSLDLALDSTNVTFGSNVTATRSDQSLITYQRLRHAQWFLVSRSIALYGDALQLETRPPTSPP